MSIIARAILESKFTKPFFEDEKKVAKFSQLAAYGTLIATISCCAFLILFPIVSFVMPSLLESSTLLGRITIFFLTSKLFSLTILFANILSGSFYLYSLEKRVPTENAELQGLKKEKLEKKPPSQNVELLKLRSENADLIAKLEEERNKKPQKKPVERKSRPEINDRRLSQPAEGRREGITRSQTTQSAPTTPQKGSLERSKTMYAKSIEESQKSLKVTERPAVKENAFNEDSIFTIFKKNEKLEDMEWLFLYTNFKSHIDVFFKEYLQIKTLLETITKLTKHTYAIENFANYKEDLIQKIPTIESLEPTEIEALSRFDPLGSVKYIQNYFLRASNYNMENGTNSPESKKLFIHLLQKLCGINSLGSLTKEFFLERISPCLDLEMFGIALGSYIKPYITGEETLLDTETVIEKLIKAYSNKLTPNLSQKGDIKPFLQATAFEIKRRFDPRWLAEILQNLYSDNIIDNDEIGTCIKYCQEFMKTHADQRTLYNQLVVAYKTGVLDINAIPPRQEPI